MWRSVIYGTVAVTVAASVARLSLEIGDSLSDVEREPVVVGSASPSGIVEAPEVAGGSLVRDLGRDLFFDPRLSRDRSLSCASCHDPRRGGVDGRRLSVGVQGKELAKNTPTVLNVAHIPLLSWLGRTEDLAAFGRRPLENEAVMGIKVSQVVERLRSDRDLASRFARAFDSGLTEDTLLEALAVYQRTLVTPGSPYDRFLAGDRGALTQRQRRGMALFRQLGCVNCHNGMMFGGALRLPLGVYSDEGQRTEFLRVPSLRNVAMTGPFLHDGSVESLHDVVRIMAEKQVGQVVVDDEIDAIVGFLEALTGDEVEAR